MQSMASEIPVTVVEVPTGHKRQADKLDPPSVERYVPRGHGMQTSALISGVYVPARQGEQDEAPAEEEKVPGLHGMQVDDELEPLTFEAVPAGQVAHEIRVCPLSSLYVPAGQSKQAVDLFEAPENDP
jgi:hypothetical protein